MSERNGKVRLVDMLQTAERVVASLRGVDVETFLNDGDKRDATVYRLQVIGEASFMCPTRSDKHIPRWNGSRSRACGSPRWRPFLN
ncbi:MAG: DUF86 domain-containing protein [Flavobacteriales bacterium]|nr:DUF86 domain-containing protein [Flavobacteriales bacterium]